MSIIRELKQMMEELEDVGASELRKGDKVKYKKDGKEIVSAFSGRVEPDGKLIMFNKDHVSQTAIIGRIK